MPRVEALIVNQVGRGPGQMTGMGDDLGTSLLNTVTGGEYDRITQQLNTLEVALKISIAASVLAGGFALSALLRGK